MPSMLKCPVETYNVLLVLRICVVELLQNGRLLLTGAVPV